MVCIEFWCECVGQALVLSHNTSSDSDWIFPLCDTGLLGHFSGFLTCSFLPPVDSGCQKTAKYAKILGALPVTIVTRDQASVGMGIYSELRHESHLMEAN